MFVDQLNRAGDKRFRPRYLKELRVLLQVVRIMTELRPDKDLIDVRIENKTPVGDVRAVKLRVRRIWTVNNAIGLMGISVAHRMLILRSWILFSGVLWTYLR